MVEKANSLSQICNLVKKRIWGKRVSTQEQYPTDLTDSQWALIEPLLPVPRKIPGGPGRPTSNLRQVINGILYVNKTGCQWRMTPKTYGPWNTIYGYFNLWSEQGVWSHIMDTLRGGVRVAQGRAEQPSAGCLDSQSVKTATQGESTGYDGNKKIKGRKRHVLVDTLGLIIVVVVTAAAEGDRLGLRTLLQRYFNKGLRRLRKLWVDGGYTGSELKQWVAGLKKTHKIALEVVERLGDGFQVVKRRWVVERTFAWLFNYRRHSKDYEVLTRNSESMIQISMIHILVRRLA